MDFPEISHRFPIRHLGDLQIIQDQLGGEASTHQHQWPEWFGKGRKQSRPTRTVYTFGILLDDFGCVFQYWAFLGIIVQSYLHYWGSFHPIVGPQLPTFPAGFSPHAVAGPSAGADEVQLVHLASNFGWPVDQWHSTGLDRHCLILDAIRVVWKKPRRFCGGAFQVKKYLECLSFAVWKLLPYRIGRGHPLLVLFLTFPDHRCRAHADIFSGEASWNQHG